MPQRVQTLRSSTKNTRPTAGTREPGELFVSFADLQLGVINAGRVAQDLIAVRFFSSATNYAVGDFVINGGVGYRANTTIVAGTFNASQWDTIATAPAMALKEDKINPGTTADYWRGDKTWVALTKSSVGLGNVDNTSDVNKPVSTAQATADALRVAKAGDTMSGHLTLPTGPAAANAVRKDYVDLGDATAANAIALKANIDNPTLTGDPRAPTPPTSDNDTSIATTAYVKAQGYITDAPNDSNAYGRKAAAWVDVTEEAPSDSLTYGRKNGAWSTIVGGAVISDTPPPGPLQAGQLWWESDSGAMFLWYIDPGGGSGQWVQVNNATAPGATAQTRNRIVNGAMQITQENATATEAAAQGYYPADQWFGLTNTTGAILTSRQATVSLRGSPNCIMGRVSVVDTSLSAGEYAMPFVQKIEGTRISDFQWGTASAKPAVLRFIFHTSAAGTYTLNLRHSSGTPSFVHPFVVPANVQTEYTVPIPACTIGTWLADNSSQLELRFVIAAASSLDAPSNDTWLAGNYTSAAGMSNGMAAAGTFRLWDVGLYLDPQNTGIAPPWQMPDEAQELAACQRYWAGGRLTFSGNVTSGSGYYALGCVPVPMRTTPALSGTNVSGTAFPATVGSMAVGGINVREQRLASASAAGVFSTDMVANSRM